MRVVTMWKRTLILMCLSGCCLAGPLHGVKRNVPVVMREEDPVVETRPEPELQVPDFPEMPSTLTLPSNATSIRADITDNFSCDDKVYGYYADMENDCQIFHICLPVTYADGKENTFRWSFICPEETIFSQDSFTCMRREDMSIECQDSVKYYELNRIFGMAEEQTGNVLPANEEQAEMQPVPAEPVQQDIEEPATMPEEEPEMAAAPAPALTSPKPKPMKERPAKLPKPNRRKPQAKPQKGQAATYLSNKTPSVMPLRKMPNVGSKVPAYKPTEVVVTPEAVAAESKPVPPRYKKRPTVTFTSEKEVVAESPAPPFKIDLTYTATNPETYKRKRPIFADKTNAAALNVAEKVPIVETAPEPAVVEPVESAVKLETSLGSAPAPTLEGAENIEKPVAVKETQVASEPAKAVEDAEPQASEGSEVIVVPESVLKADIVSTNLKDAVAAETVLVEKNREEEEVKKNEVPIAQEAENAEKLEAAATQPLETVVPIEAIEEIPAVVSENVQSSHETEKETSLQTSNAEGEAQAEGQALPEEPAAPSDQLTGFSDPAPLSEVPEVVAVPIENSEETLPALPPSLEEMEEQKPSDAVESMPATPEMEQQDPIVQQAFAEGDSHLQSVGGFKPVDPELAAEAEALLSDFVNHLKSDHPNVKPMITLPTEEGASSLATAEVSAESVGTKVEIEEPQAGKDKIVGEKADGNSLKTTETEQPAPYTMDKETNVAEIAAPAEQEAIKDPLLLKFPMTNSFPADMYHIPVTVIHTPYEEMVNVAEPVMQESQKKTEEQVKVEETQAEAEAPAQIPAQEEQHEVVKTIPEELASIQEEQLDKKKVENQPAEEAQPEVLQPETDSEIEAQPDIVQAPSPAAEDSQAETEKTATPVAYRPISIDDIVELVKERLDQTPSDEKGTPMELVMDTGSADKPVELKFSTQQKGTATEEESAEQTPSEDIIFPIYHRLSEAPIAVDEPSVKVTEIEKNPTKVTNVKNVDEAVHTEAVIEELSADKVTATNTKTPTVSAPAEETENSAAAELTTSDAPAPAEASKAAAEGNVKTGRAFRTRSLAKAKLDPRKRRFLFKADAS